MEDTLWEHLSKGAYKTVAVLILVLMEDTLWVIIAGIALLKGLNPCFNGRYSLSNLIVFAIKSCLVLILVLMEDTLWVLWQIQ